MTRAALHARCAIVLCLVQRCLYKINDAGSGMKRGRLTVAERAFQADTRSVCIISTTVGQYFN